MSYVLKTCPFCGSTDLRVHVKEFENIDVKLRQVECFKCGAAGPPHLDIGDEDNTAQRWNKRVQQ